MCEMITELKVLDGDNSLFSKGVSYVVPRYQRAYAWEDKEIQQLIEDIRDSSGEYYIGSLVVAKVDGKKETYEVIDGQQRLTTLYLLLHYLHSKGKIASEIGNTLSFDCRPKSIDTLRYIKDLLPAGTSKIEEGKEWEQSLLNGIKAIDQRLKIDDNIAALVDRLKHVILYRIQVPEHTDLNRYFEIMNTRGEQLEQHDILKAQLMGNLMHGKDNVQQRLEQEAFSVVWVACSDMTGYVQMHLEKVDREELFGASWGNMPSKTKGENTSLPEAEAPSRQARSIEEIIQSPLDVKESECTEEDDMLLTRFESIIDFPNFLLHVLRAFVFINEEKFEKQPELSSLLDDKKLLRDFDCVIDAWSKTSNSIGEAKCDFSQQFILFLLQARFLFDKFIIKRESTGEDRNGSWSLKMLLISESKGQKKAYYANTPLTQEGVEEKDIHASCLMIQSALRVSYTSPKVMHWITELLKWLILSKGDQSGLAAIGEGIAAKAVEMNFLNQSSKDRMTDKYREYKFGDYAAGVATPHIVFNYLDYLLWKRDGMKIGDFVFEFRNSVEHWYPQHPSDGTFKAWAACDTFGNLCLLSRSVNSKFSNLSPESKMKSYKPMVQKGSLKLRKMGAIIEGCSSDEWMHSKCAEHEKEMLQILHDAVEETLKKR